MATNLLQHRGVPSIWDVTPAERDSERWLAAMAAGALVAAGFRRRSPVGLLMMVAAGALGWWAAMGIETRKVRRGQFIGSLPSSKPHGDPVREASEDSFPASDAPSWTPMTGNPGAVDTVPVNR
jgi:hypothetical protein